MIFVLDNYDSFTYNLVHLVGQHTDEVKVVRNDAMTVEEVNELNPDGILISPGPGHPGRAGITEDLIREMGASTPILGVCLGHQAIGEVFGGTVARADTLMHGKTSPVEHDGRTIFEGVPTRFDATRYHSLIIDRETFPHDELEISAESDEGTIMALRHRSLPIEGIQFHPESVMTKAGPRLIANWLQTCGVEIADEVAPAR
jgi:anthranilate synthase/aminodeoxychorismate synthase-like glutamine amidotransferase